MTQPAAARSGRRHVSQPLGRLGAARQPHARSGARDRAVHGRLRRQRQHRQPHLSLAELGGQLAGHALVARVGVVRHRRPEHEVRLPGRLPGRQRAGTSPNNTNTGVPRQQRRSRTRSPRPSSPSTIKQRVRYDSLYAQEQWTIGRVTVQGALRYDRAWSWFPEVTVGPHDSCRQRSPIRRRRACTATTTSRRAAAWRGTCSAPARRRSRSTSASTCRRRRHGLTYSALRPSGRLTTTVTRTWTDANSDFVPDCDLQDPLAQDNATSGDFCAQISTLNFGKDVFTSDLDPAARSAAGASARATGSTACRSSSRCCRASRSRSATTGAGSTTSR